VEGFYVSITIARRLRKSMSPPERRLWWALMACSGEFKFRRQHAVGPFVLDFFCAPAALCVEVDGATHYADSQATRDKNRDDWLARKGIATIRVPSTEVRDNVEGVVMLILEAARSRTPPPRKARFPSPRNRGEEE
jgi:very-short-patch-repair endonuclease